MKSSGIIYSYDWDHPKAIVRAGSAPRTRQHASGSLARVVGVGLIALAFGGLIGPMTPFIRLEAEYRYIQAKSAVQQATVIAMREFKAMTTHQKDPVASKATAKPVVFAPLTSPDGTEITPVDTNFGLIVPKIGINAKVIPSVNPTKPGEYEKALEQGVAHASTSFFPDENGTVYLFSHSTSYDWFVKDLNAVFYLLKNVDVGDQVVLMYKGEQYVYQITDKKVVSPESVSYLVPHAGVRNLILQTCWPPGSTEERLLIFADLVKNPNEAI